MPFQQARHCAAGAAGEVVRGATDSGLTTAGVQQEAEAANLLKPQVGDIWYAEQLLTRDHKQSVAVGTKCAKQNLCSGLPADGP